jgi:hypothetical protein
MGHVWSSGLAGGPLRASRERYSDKERREPAPPAHQFPPSARSGEPSSRQGRVEGSVIQIVAHRRPAAAPQQTQELAAIIHLCGAGSARAFARRGFSPTACERCGDHDVAGYLAQINMMTREFQRFAADERTGIQ